MRRGLIVVAALAAACGTLTTGPAGYQTQSYARWDIGGVEPLEYLGGNWYREIQPLYGGPGYWGGASPWGWGALSPWGWGIISPWGWGAPPPVGWGSMTGWGMGGMSGIGQGPGMWPPRAGQPRPGPQPTAYPTGSPTPMPNGMRPPLRDSGVDGVRNQLWGR